MRLADRPNLTRGDIVIGDLGDKVPGRIIHGKRPVVVLSDMSYGSLAVVAPFTSSHNLYVSELPLCLEINAAKYRMDRAETAILIRHIRGIEQKNLHGKIGQLDKRDLERLDEMVAKCFGNQLIKKESKENKEGEKVNELSKVFEFNGSQVRTVKMNGEPWFVAKDVCDILELDNSSQALTRLDADEKNTITLNEGIGNPLKSVVSESGLYSLILSSRKPEAKQFKKWITSEVLPAIRQTGSYSIQKSPAELIAAGYKAALDMIEEMKPKAEKFDLLMDSSNYQTMEQAAKPINIGRNNLFKLLREKKILTKSNLPYQQYIDLGYFVVKENPTVINNGSQLYSQTYVTAKGINFLSEFVAKCRQELNADAS